MKSIELSKIYPRDRLDIDPNGVNIDHDISLSRIPDILAYLIEIKLNCNPTHKMVIEQFSLRHPHWLVTHVEVYAGNEYIGSLGVDGYTDRITLRNRAINEVMVRKGYMASSKANQLSANYDKFFRPATPLQQANLLRKEAYNEMARGKMAEANKSLAPTRAFVESLTDYIMQNFDKYKEIAINSGWSSEHQDTLPSLYSDYTLVASIAPSPKLHNKNSEGFYFYVSDGVCLATDYRGHKIGAHYSNNLPTELAGRIGMLKLAEDKTFIRNVGYRQQQDFFYILGDYNEYTK
jgi:hypothetical protein